MPQLSIQQIYLKDLSFQAPSGAAIFTREWKPEIKVDIKVVHQPLSGGLMEVVLTLSIVATSAGATAFLIEILQAGIFRLSGYDPVQLERALMSQCPTILLPYARETVDTVLMKGRFPALIIDPIDFEANLPPVNIARG